VARVLPDAARLRRRHLGTTREEALEQIRAIATMIVQRMAEEKMSVVTEPADLTPTPTERVVVTVGVPAA